MKIIFLGTGTSQGVPVIACNCDVCRSSDAKDKRLRSSVLVDTERNTFIIDAGPDFRQQMLRENISRIDAVLITHGHKDHIGWLDDVRAFNYFQKGPVNIYASKKVLEVLKTDFFYAFEDERYPGVPEMSLHSIENAPFEINSDKIIPVEVMHYRLPVFGYRINDFTYITDANFISEKELEKVKGSRIVVLNALRRKEHISHFSLKEAVKILTELKPETAYITHISHQLGKYDDLVKELPSFIKVAYDGLEIAI